MNILQDCGCYLSDFSLDGLIDEGLLRGQFGWGSGPLRSDELTAYGLNVVVAAAAACYALISEARHEYFSPWDRDARPYEIKRTLYRTRVLKLGRDALEISKEEWRRLFWDIRPGMTDFNSWDRCDVDSAGLPLLEKIAELGLAADALYPRMPAESILKTRGIRVSFGGYELIRVLEQRRLAPNDGGADLHILCVAPDGGLAILWFACTRDGEGCDLLSVPRGEAPLASLRKGTARRLPLAGDTDAEYRALKSLLLRVKP